MKIAIVNKHRDDSIGGSELQCDFLGTELTRLGNDVAYIAPGGSQKEYLKPYDVYPCEYDASAIVRTVIQTKPDIVYWRFNRNEFYDSVKPIRMQGIPVVFASSHVNDHKPWLLKKGQGIKQQIKFLFKNRREFKGFKYVDGMTVNNKEFLDRVSHPFKIYIPNGMITDFIEFTWKRPYCLWVANLKKPKRPELFVELAREFADKKIDFLIAGLIQQTEYDWINNPKNIPQNVHYLGPKKFEEINGMMNSALFHIHTCVPEGFPNIFLQAWRQGKPSISYGYDPSGLIQKHKLGYYSAEDWETFKEQANSLINNPELRDKIGEKARIYSEEQFSVEKSATLLEKFLKRVIESVKNP